MLCFWSTEILLARITYYLQTTMHPFFGPPLHTFHYSTKAIIACHSVHSKPVGASFILTCAPAQFQVHIIVLLHMYKIIIVLCQKVKEMMKAMTQNMFIEVAVTQIILSCTL